MMLFAPRLNETSPVRSRLACRKHQANGVLHYETRVAPTARQFVPDAARGRDVIVVRLPVEVGLVAVAVGSSDHPARAVQRRLCVPGTRRDDSNSGVKNGTLLLVANDGDSYPGGNEGDPHPGGNEGNTRPGGQ